MMRKILATLVVILFAITSVITAQELRLRSDHRDWIERYVMAITTDTERESFHALESDELRDKFIDVFWQKRDPTPGTQRNEFQEEHKKRFEYANMYFGSRLAQDGYRNDRGKIYQLLGKPNQRYEYSSDTFVYPCELWYYQSDPRYMNSSFFYLIFFKRNGGGDYLLYSPLADGPDELTWKGNFDESPETVLRSIKMLSPDLATASEGYDPMNPGNAMKSEVIMAEIFALPERLVDKQWAVDFLESKGKADVNYTFVAVNIPSLQFVHTPLDGRQELHYSFLVKPSDINVGQHDDTFYVAYEIIPSLADSEGNIIYENTNKVEMEWDQSSFASFKNKPTLFADNIPLIPGDYTFTVRIHNNTAKTLFYYTTPLKVGVPRSGNFELGEVFFSYQQKPVEQTRKKVPFNFFNYQFTPSLIDSFATIDNVHLFTELNYPVREGNENDVDEISYEFKIFNASDELQIQLTHIVTPEWLLANNYGIHYLSRQIPIAGLVNGDYRLEITAKDANGIYTDTVEKKFSITLPENIARPNVISLHNYSTAKTSDLLVKRGEMLRQAGFFGSAKVEFESALRQDNENVEAAIGLAKNLLLQNQAEEAYDTLQGVEHVDPNNRDLVVLLAQAAHSLGKSEKAIEYYRRLIFFLPDDVELLNGIAYLLLEVGETNEAIQILEKSLLLETDQPPIKTLLDTLR